MRHRLIFLLCLVLLTGTTAGAQADNALTTLPQDQLDVVKVLLAQERAWNEGKLDEFLTGYAKTPQTIFMGETIHHGFDMLSQRYHAEYANRDAMGTLSFSELGPRLLDDHFATVTGRYHLERGKKSGGNADGVFSLVLEKTAAGWKIILDHTS